MYYVEYEKPAFVSSVFFRGERVCDPVLAANMDGYTEFNCVKTFCKTLHISVVMQTK